MTKPDSPQMKSHEKSDSAIAGFSRLDELRVKTGKTWADLASDLKVDASFFFHVKAGRRRLGPKVLRRLEDAERDVGIVPTRTVEELQTVPASEIGGEELVGSDVPFTLVEAERLLAMFDLFGQFMQSLAPAMKKLKAMHEKNLPADVAGNKRKLAAKQKRARRPVGSLTDVAEVSLDEFECSAGQPLCFTSQPIGTVRVPSRFDLPGAFVLRINGDSMNTARLTTRLGGGCGILPGERVVMQRTEDREPQEGDIVAACIEGGCTLKRLRGPEGTWRLEPESNNPLHQPFTLRGEGEKGRIQAVMIGKV